MHRRREFMRTGVAAGTIWLAGCSDMSMPWNQTMTWEEAFSEGTSTDDRALLRKTPVVVDKVTTRVEVKTALGVLAWTTAADGLSTGFLKDMDDLAASAREVRELLRSATTQLDKGLSLVEKMKNTSHGGISVWNVATTFAPSLKQFEAAARDLKQELNQRAAQAAEIRTATRNLVSYFREIRSSRATDYGRLPEALHTAISEYQSVIQEVADMQKTINELRKISAEAADAAGDIPVFGGEVAAVYSSLHEQLTELNQRLEAFQSELKNRRATLVETRRQAADTANQRYREISRMATGSEEEMDVMTLDTGVRAYGRQPSEETGTGTPPVTSTPSSGETPTAETGGDTPGLQPAEELKGYWPLDAVSGGTVPDRSGHGHTGTVHGAPKQIPGAVGQALEFDGQDDFVEVDMTPALQTTGSFTLEVWIRTTESTTGSTPLGLYTYDGSGRGEGTHVKVKSDAISFQARHSSGFGQPGGGAKNDPYYHIPGEAVTIAPNQWHHAALKYDKGAQIIALYVDGNQEFSLEAPKDPRVDDSFLAIGARPKNEGAGSVSVGSYFKGGVDEVVVYTQALSDAVIRQHANRDG